MSELIGCLSTKSALLASVLVLVLPQLSACGPTSSSPRVAVSLAGIPSSSAQVAALPATVGAFSQMTPTFNPAIHDYVFGCSAYSGIRLNVSLPSGILLGWIDASGASGQPPPSSAGMVQHTFSLVPGQRFQFSLSNNPEKYSVRCVPSDFPPLSVSFAGRSSVGPLVQPLMTAPKPAAEWYLFNPSIAFPPATAPAPSYIVLTDSNGTPVWWMADTSHPFDAKVLGPKQITWTTGAGPLPTSDYIVRNFSGQIVNVLGTDLDGHDIQPTSNGTYLTIQHIFRSCPSDCADLSPWGAGAQSSVLDEEVAEIDSNSNVLWSWKTRDHISLAETGDAGWLPGVGFDIIHMNSVEPDGPDAVIFSARHLSAVYRIIKSTGAIDWKLGGTHTVNSLTVVGDTRPTALGPNGQPLSGQHDARRWPDGTVSVHDNGTNANRAPFVVRYRIDTASRTAQVVQEFSDPRVPESLCCGSARLLPDGHWVVQWGGAPFFTEFDENGESVFSIEYNLNGVFSYRAIPVSSGVIAADTLRSGMDAMAPSP